MNRAYPWLTTGLILKAAQAGACDDGIHRANLALMGVASAFPGYGTILDEDLTWLAEQPFATSEILKSLEAHPSIRVRRAVAYNHNTQIDTLRILTEDSSMAVRQAALHRIRSRFYVCGKTQQWFDREDRILARIKVVEPEANVCYYPVEDECVVHVWGRPLSGHRSSRLDALLDAAQKLKLSTD